MEPLVRGLKVCLAIQLYEEPSVYLFCLGGA